MMMVMVLQCEALKWACCMIRMWEDVYATRETHVDIIDSAKTDDAMTSDSSIPPTTNHHSPPAAGKKTP